MPPIRDDPQTLTPTPAAAPSGEWKARPVLAWFIRLALILIPLVISWLSVHFAIRLVPRPDGIGATVGWFFAAVVLSMVVFEVSRRIMGRASPLGVLFSLSLTFPDAAPSRMRAFLSTGRSTEQSERLAALAGDSLENSMKAKRLADLLTKVSRREARTGRHGDRVRGYAELIAKELGVPEEDLQQLQWATLLHDVGLLDVPRRILDTRGGLDPEDRLTVEQHPVHAVGYLSPFAEWLGDWTGAATDHHERWDGTGYPAGLAGEQISLAGRIVAVADAYDAMTAARSYQKPIAPAAARRELVDNAGTQFDPAVVRAFLNAGIDTNRAGLGALGALAEAPAQLLSLLSGAGTGAAAGAGIAVASAVAVAGSAVALPAIFSAEVAEPSRAERVVEEPVVETTTTTTRAPTTTRPRRTTTTSVAKFAPPTTTTTTTTTTLPPTTAAPVVTAPPTTQAPATTAPPPPPTTTAAPSYPTLPVGTAPIYPST